MKVRLKPADRYLSLCVRKRDMWTCQYSGKIFEPGSQGLHCAHIFSRRHFATRWVPMNCISLSFGAHRKFDEDHEFKREFAIKFIGQTMYDELNEWRQRIVKISKGDQKLIARYYKHYEESMRPGEHVYMPPTLQRMLIKP